MRKEVTTAAQNRNESLKYADLEKPDTNYALHDSIYTKSLRKKKVFSSDRKQIGSCLGPGVKQGKAVLRWAKGVKQVRVKERECKWGENGQVTAGFLIFSMPPFWIWWFFASVVSVCVCVCVCVRACMCRPVHWRVFSTLWPLPTRCQWKPPPAP